MGKDPAVLFYIDNWLVSTAEMEADCRGWYLNLLLHNYDKGSLPNDVEKLAVLCNVRFSEFERFKHVFEHILKQKFELAENGRLTNHMTTDILKKRNDFKESRSNAGKASYVMRYFAKKYIKEFNNQDIKYFVKENFDYSIDIKNEQMLKQVFEHLFELYINGDGNGNNNRDREIDNKGGKGGKQNDDPAPEQKSKKRKYAEFVSMTESEYQKLLDEHGEENTKELISILNNYKGSKGKKYKSDYLAILNWVVDRLYEKQSKHGFERKTDINRGAGFTNNQGASGNSAALQGKGEPGSPFTSKDYSERF